MSYAVYVVRFDHGEPVGLSADAFAEVFGPHMTETQSQFQFHRVVAPDGGDAEIYADLDPPFDSLSFGRFSPGDVCELLVRFAHRCDTPILLPEDIAVLTNPDQAQHLPAEFRDDVRLAVDGGDLLTAIGET